AAVGLRRLLPAGLVASGVLGAFGAARHVSAPASRRGGGAALSPRNRDSGANLAWFGGMARSPATHGVAGGVGRRLARRGRAHPERRDAPAPGAGWLACASISSSTGRR